MQVTTMRREGDNTHTRTVRTLPDGSQTIEKHETHPPAPLRRQLTPAITDITVDEETPARAGWFSWLWGK